MADRIGQVQTGFMGSIFDGFFKGDYSSNQSATKTVTQIGTGLIPIVGQVADARDTMAAIGEVGQGRSGSWGNLGLALVGWVPLAGDFIKSARKIGFANTFGEIGEAFGSIGESWRAVKGSTDEKLGEVRGLFYKPETNLISDDLPEGVYGITNRWGDVEISDALDPATAASTRDHEWVHSVLSPKLTVGQELRANLSILGYAESHLLRRLEEGLAEGWARWKSDGISGILKGWRFPYDNPYGIDPERVKIERNILVGMTSSAAATGFAIGQEPTNGE